MAYSMDSTTDGCYPGTTCLINKLGIRDEVALTETETAVVLGKASLLDQQMHVSSAWLASAVSACPIVGWRRR